MTATLGNRVGHYFNSYNFVCAYHGDIQIGSICSQCEGEQIREFHREMCAKIEKRSGKPTHEFFGGYYQD